MKIAFYDHGIEFDGNTPYRQPLCGSESGIVHMARELARCGHDVTVYCNLPIDSENDSAPVQANGFPAYRHYHMFFTDCLHTPWDALISLRSFDPFLLGRVAPRMIFWTGDASDQPAMKHFERRSIQDNIDLILCVSDWHRATFVDAFELPDQKVVATRHGFDPGLICNRLDRQWRRAVYSSPPFRGLDVLLTMFPEIRHRVTDFRLDVYSSMKVYGWTSERDQYTFGALYQAAAEAGVNWHGSVSQPVLRTVLGGAGLFLYPNTFDETSCIAAIEAQASGCVAVTSARAALNETVEHGQTGFCIKGDPRSESYKREFITAVCGLMENQALLERLSDAARKRAFRRYTWSTIAGEWTALLESMPAQPVHARTSGPLSLLQKAQEYLRNGNVHAAARVLAALDQTPF